MQRYRSKFRNLKIPMKKSYKQQVEGQVITIPGTKIEFNDFLFETDNKDIIKFLDTDSVCLKMQSNHVFAKIDEGSIEAAKETLEEREHRLKKEMDKLKEEKKTATTKEKGKKQKVDAKKDKPVY